MGMRKDYWDKLCTGGRRPPDFAFVYCFLGVCLVILQNLLLYLRERVFISCHAARNEPKKRAKEGGPTVRPLWNHPPLTCANPTPAGSDCACMSVPARMVASAAACRTREFFLGKRGSPRPKVAARPLVPKGWSQARQSAALANPDWGNGGHLNPKVAARPLVSKGWLGGGL